MNRGIAQTNASGNNIRESVLTARNINVVRPRCRSARVTVTIPQQTRRAAHSVETSSTESPKNGSSQVPQDAVGPPRFCANQYAENNRPQRKHSKLVLEFSQPAFLVESSDTMRILDVGCGTGDFTRDILLPSSLPCEKIIGVDSSPDMIKYADRYSAHEKIEYQQLDIGRNVSEFLGHYGQFDRVYSFYCLQWIKDEGAALKNIASLLSPGGQCLLVFPATQHPATVWSRLARMSCWEKYSETLTKFISESHYIKDRKEQLLHMSALLRDANLSPSIFVLPRLVTFDGWSEQDVIVYYLAVRLCPSAYFTAQSPRFNPYLKLEKQQHARRTQPSEAKSTSITLRCLDIMVNAEDDVTTTRHRKKKFKFKKIMNMKQLSK
ncbi:hypothetical protein HPB50_024716 [Hyalomma asiaticum]|uniref:Uncharacterized protein n=1 Tax=Hyalomma asiaticum TaxID=266040 RepID=A0ACB7SYS0_HYAAI|nr:hypothetical protein HPB50_024716 [Hyalomma asiaticum]